MKQRTQMHQLEIFDDEGQRNGDGQVGDIDAELEDIPEWPTHDLFPYNRGRKDGKVKKVGDWIVKDLERGRNLLIITGFTSLSRIISFLAKCEQKGDFKENIRLVIGYDVSPMPQRRAPIGGEAVDEDIRSYLLQQRLSVYQSHDVIRTKNMLAKDHVQVRTSRDTSRRVHAKIYKSDDVITFGSSNFSQSGLEELIEVNLRLQRTTKEHLTLSRNMSRYAEQIWTISTDYKKQLGDLLNRLLQEVSWDEALARGCAELLEGVWAKRYIETISHANQLNLFPFQTQGITEAMYIIEDVGSILVADATGSGKTRMGMGLLKSVVHKMWRDPSRLLNVSPVLLSPPKVLEKWDDVASRLGFIPQLFSHGEMSNSKSRKHKQLIRAIRRAQVIAIDEAHNFLNRQSQRSQVLTRNIADHVLLFTATPINTDPTDLFRMVTLLGPDNFDDDVIEALEDILGTPRRRRNTGRHLTTEQLNRLQDTIRRFTLRRTKHMINHMIEVDCANNPDTGSKFRYPQHKQHVYACEGTAQDQQLALEIQNLAQQLKGLLWLREPLKQPLHYERTDEQYLEQRLLGAKGLAWHVVLDRLRSSRVALLEHIYGTVEASKFVGLPETIKAKQSGNVLAKLHEIAGKPPENLLVHATLPDWLSDPLAHAAACKTEIQLYERIGNLTKNISPSREQAKIQQILLCLNDHKSLIAFDHHVISLYLIQSLLPKAEHRQILVVTGDSTAQLRQIQQLLDPDMDQDEVTESKWPVEVLGLCSDALSEGVNLQKASAIVHLDMPTVVSRAEQRLGRIDRINSPHKHIESWWPKDSPAFAPRGDEKFFDRLFFVHDVLGANFDVPNIYEHQREQITPEYMFKELYREEMNREQEARDEDVFAPIRALVIGEQSLIPEKVYFHIRRQPESIHTSVSIVQSTTPWAFLTIKGENGGAPRLVYFDHPSADPLTKLTDIAQALRSRLSSTTKRRRYDTEAQARLEQFVQRLAETQHLLLPRKKQRVLQEMKLVLEYHLKHQGEGFYHQESEKEVDRTTFVDGEEQIHHDQHPIEMLLDILGKQRHHSSDRVDEYLSIDLNILAERWLDFIRPTFESFLERPQRKRKLIRLKDIRSILKNKPITASDFEQILKPESLWILPLHKRVVAAIIGIPDIE